MTFNQTLPTGTVLLAALPGMGLIFVSTEQQPSRRRSVHEHETVQAELPSIP